LKCRLQYRVESIPAVLAIVKQTHAAIAEIDAEVAFLSHQENSRTIVDMAVIVDVNQHVLFHGLLLDPATEHGNVIADVYCSGIFRENLDSDSLKIHYGSLFRRSAIIPWPA